jgi:predicted RND superfamily exporter protein
MRIVSAFVIKHRKTVMVLFIAVAVLCGLLQLGVTVNFNVTDYLPKNAQSTKAINLMDEEFGDAVPNARVLLRGVSVQEALQYKEKLKAVGGVSDVVWLDDVVDLKKPLETADQKTVEDYYRNGDALISLTIRGGDEVRVTDDIYALIGNGNALSGNAVDIATAQRLAGSETRTAMLILIPVIILILLLATESWLEPILYLGSIGISVLINMGTNLIFGEISFVTNAVSPILQLAVSMDYAIFLLRSFEEYRKTVDSPAEAMKLAMKRAFSAIAASAATTLFGFMALVFMKFGIGSDMGVILTKGIVLSFLCVILFLPALTLCTYKLIDKTKHRRFLPEFRSAGRVVSKVRVPALILVLLLLVPCYLAQGRNDFTYGMGSLGASTRSGQDKETINGEFGRSTAIVLLVPKGDTAKERLLSRDLLNTAHVTGVLSYATAVGAEVPSEFLDSAVSERFYSEHYSRIIVYTDTSEEGAEAFSVVEKVQSEARGYYGDAVLSCGQSVNMYDMKNVITDDNKLVNALAVISILLVLLVTFRSLTLPLILIITIEAAIWINLSFPYFTGSPLCYIGYLVINTVQLGATVDYAILQTTHYTYNRKIMGKKEAIIKTLGEVFRPILISGSILSLSGFALFMTSSNQIVSDLGLLLGRGTILSMLLVYCFLPAALWLFDGLIAKTTYRSDFIKGDSHNEKNS